MKNTSYTIIVSSLAFLAAMTACHKNGLAAVEDDGKEIVLSVREGNVSVDVESKAVTAVSSIPSSLYWGATTGSGTETAQWSSTLSSVSDNKIMTGQYQTIPAVAYNYYVSNVALSVGANTTVSATGGTSGTDVICGRTAASSSSTPSVTLGHVFARTGTLSISASTGTLTGVSYTIKTNGSNLGTAGTYNLRTGAWSSTSGLSSATSITGSSDMYIIPGSYTIAVTATYTRGDYVVTQTKSANVTFIGNRVNNVSFTWPDGGTEIIVSVSLTPWSSQNVAATVEEDYALPGEFSVSSTKKVKFAPGNLQTVIGSGPDATGYNYTASSWKFAEHQWDIIGNNAGNNSFAVGSTVDLFGWVGASASYDSYGLCTNTAYNNAYYGTSGSDALKTDWGSIQGVVSSCGSGWRTLTTTEWNYLFTRRANASSLYGHCQITTASGTVTGMLILPDNWTKPSNCTVTPGAGAFNRVTYSATAASGNSNAWCDMEAAGAVFFAAAGYRDGVGVDQVGGQGYYWSSSVDDEEWSYRFYFYNYGLNSQSSYDRCLGLSVRLVKEAN